MANLFSPKGTPGTSIEELTRTPAPIISTSDTARQGFNDNVSALGNMEANITEPNGALSVSTSNPALQNVVGSVNQSLEEARASGVEISPEIQRQLLEASNLESDKMLALSRARDAADIKDPTILDESLTEVKTKEEEQKSSLESLITELRDARSVFTESLGPTERETELQRSLKKLRSERELLPIELRQEGISAGAIQGRQIEDERVRAIQESNLLFELGLEQQGRQAKTQAAEAGISFIGQDIELQQNIQDRLDKSEANIVEQARTLRKEALNALSNVVDTFEGLSFNDMDSATQEELINTFNSFGIPLNLGIEALRNAKQQQILRKARSGGFSISDTQTGKGANAAGISIQEFQQLDADTQNTIIQNASAIENEKDIIDEALLGNKKLSNVLSSITESTHPDPVKEVLTNYAKATAEGIPEKVGLLQRIKGFFGGLKEIF